MGRLSDIGYVNENAEYLSVVIGEYLFADESAVEGQRGEPLNAASLLGKQGAFGSQLP